MTLRSSDLPPHLRIAGADPAPAEAARVTGAYARGQGESWELVCRQVLMADVELDPPVPQASRTIRRGGVKETVRQRSPVDFAGTVRATGRSYRADAKSYQRGARLELGRRGLKEHQARQLIDHGRAGAVAGVLVELRGRDEVWWVGWGALRLAEIERQQAVPLRDDSPHCIRLGDRARWAIRQITHPPEFGGNLEGARP